MSVRSFATKPDLSSALGKAVAEVVAAADPGRPFTVALSGGSLPALLAAGLLATEGIDYSNWHIFFADERVVPLDDADSNYKACDEVFFSKVGIARERIYTVDATLSAEEAAAAYTAQLQTVFTEVQPTARAGDEVYPAPRRGVPEFDLMLLGMGPDGHTASLFPGHPLLEVSDRWVAHIEDSPKLPPKRITLTYPVLNASKSVFFVCTGGGKKENLAVALGVADGSVPAGGVQPTSGNLVWFVDDAASEEYRAITAKSKFSRATTLTLNSKDDLAAVDGLIQEILATETSKLPGYVGCDRYFCGEAFTYRLCTHWDTLAHLKATDNTSEYYQAASAKVLPFAKDGIHTQLFMLEKMG